MLPPPLRRTNWALILGVVLGVSFLCLVVAMLVTDLALRDTLGLIYAIGTYLIVAPAFVAVCLVAIAVRVWRHFSSWTPH